MSKKEPRAKRVAWKESDCTKVAEAMYLRLIRGETMAVAAEAAMKSELPKDRWRSFSSAGPVLKSLRPYLEVIRKREAAHLETRVNGNNATLVKPAPVSVERDPYQPEPTPARYGWRDMLKDLICEALVAACEDRRIRSVLSGVLSEIVPSVVEEISAHFGVRQSGELANAPHIVPPRENMESVAVVGLLGRQAQTVRDLYGAYFDLRFVEPAAHKPMLLGASRGASIVYIMADFVAHRDQDLLKSIKAPVAYISGSISALEDALENRLEVRRRKEPPSVAAH